jgi:hypothetical protein
MKITKFDILDGLTTGLGLAGAFVNFFSSDSDNLIGSVLDALVESDILQNDSSGYVVASTGTFAKTRKHRGQDRPVGILIRITPAQIEYLDLSVASTVSQSVA